MYNVEYEQRVNSKIVRFFLSCFMVLWCSSVVAESTSGSKEVLKESVQARWSAFAKRSFDDVYGFQSPTYRSVFPKSLYIQQFNADSHWRLTKIESIKYDSALEIATVSIVIETKSMTLESTDQNVAISRYVEKWLRSGDQWWFITTG